MTHEQLSERWEQFGNCEYDKALYVEYMIFCNLSSDEIFNNYLKAGEITEKAFFDVLDFLYSNQCYILLYKLMRDNKIRFVKPDFDRIKNIGFKEDRKSTRLNSSHIH